MIYNGELEGKNIYLRSVEKKDAEFLLRIRGDDKKNEFVHAIDNDITKEIDWIEKQRKREGDYFFSIISKRSNSIVGNIAICEIDVEKKIAELGRWVSYAESIDNLESVILVHDFAYDYLGLDYVFTKTIQENRKVVSFWRRFGGNAEENKQVDEFTVYYNIVSKEEYKNQIRKKLYGLVEVCND